MAKRKKRITKRERSMLKKDVARIRAGVKRSTKYRRAVVVKVKEQLERRDYGPKTIKQITSHKGIGWKIRRLEREERGLKAKFTKSKAYVYAHADSRGRAVPGRWMTKGEFARREGIKRYWQDVKRMQRLYDMNTKQARKQLHRLKDKSLSLEYRQMLAAMVKEALSSDLWRELEDEIDEGDSDDEA